MVAGLCRFCHRDLAFLVKGLLTPNGRDHDRRVVFCAENADAHIDLAHVDQPTGPELEFQETFPVRPQRHLVVDTGSHVAEMRRRDVSAAHRLEIEHVDRLPGRLDQLVGAHWRPYQGIRQLRSQGRSIAGPSAAGHKQGACGEELEKLAAARSFLCKRRHAGPPSSCAPCVLAAGMGARAVASYTVRTTGQSERGRGTSCPASPSGATHFTSCTKRDASSCPIRGTWAPRVISRVSASRPWRRPARALRTRKAAPMAPCRATRCSSTCAKSWRQPIFR